MAGPVKAIPEGYRTLTPSLVVKDSARAIEFYKKVFGAEELFRMPGPGGKGVIHAELQIGDSRLFLSDEMPGMGCKSPETLKGTTHNVYMYLPDMDAVFNRAVAEGARVVMPPTDMFWGDRFAKVADPFGHEWGLATRKEALSSGELEVRSREAMKQMGTPWGKAVE